MEFQLDDVGQVALLYTSVRQSRITAEARTAHVEPVFQFALDELDLVEIPYSNRSRQEAMPRGLQRQPARTARTADSPRKQHGPHVSQMI